MAGSTPITPINLRHTGYPPRLKPTTKPADTLAKNRDGFGLIHRWCQRPYFVALRTFIDGTVPSFQTTRVQVLNDDLRNTFCRWFPGMIPDAQAPLKAAA
jgi:hypothetical protein